MKRETLLAGILSGTFLFSPVMAAELTDRISINGFANAAYQQTDEAVALHGESREGGVDNRGSFAGTSVGININADINDRVRFYSQLFAARSEGFALHIDWAFMNIDLANELGLRAGRIKFPVGLVNEYVDVGFAYPWIRPPRVVYSYLVPNGPQVTREGYNGASLLWEPSAGDWNFSADFFGGDINLDSADVRKMRGMVLRANWDDKVLLQANRYEGDMENATGSMVAMNGEKHSVSLVGVKVDWNNVIVYSEYANVTMGSLVNMKARTWYATLGYRVGSWLPFVNYESFDQGEGAQRQTFSTLGLRYDIWRATALKFELTQVDTRNGIGMFESPPGSNKTNQFGIGLSIVF